MSENINKWFLAREQARGAVAPVVVILFACGQLVSVLKKRTLSLVTSITTNSKSTNHFG